MERIVLEVDNKSALAWKNSSKAQREKLAMLLQNALSLLTTNEKQQNLDPHMQQVYKVSQKAKKNGLTSDLLNQLLRDE